MGKLAPVSILAVGLGVEELAGEGAVIVETLVSLLTGVLEIELTHFLLPFS